MQKKPSKIHSSIEDLLSANAADRLPALDKDPTEKDQGGLAVLLSVFSRADRTALQTTSERAWTQHPTPTSRSI